MKGQIKISDRAAVGAVVIDIEGVIGVAEQMQFEEGNNSISTYGSLKGLLDRASEAGASEITVNIRSTGGSVNDALLIYDFLRSTGAEITTRCYGYAASAATIIAQAASPGRREISANSLYLIHNASCETEGSSEDMTAAGDMLRETDRRIAGIYAATSGREISHYLYLMGLNGGRGRWLSPEEVIENGLADAVTGKSRISRREKRIVKNLGLPPLPAKYTLWQMIENGLEKLARTGSAGKVEPSSASEGCIKPHGKNIAPASARSGIPSVRSETGPTLTKPKEDPSVYESRLSANQEAYMQDIRNIRSL